jgi:hypothetical protein
MNLFSYDYEITLTHRQRFREEANQYPLAYTATTGGAKPNRIVEVMNAFKRAIQRTTPAGKQASPVNKVVQSVTNS